MTIAGLKPAPICFQKVIIIRGLVSGGPSVLRFLRLLKYSVEFTVYIIVILVIGLLIIMLCPQCPECRTMYPIVTPAGISVACLTPEEVAVIS
jgi:hypothetical protein